VTSREALQLVDAALAVWRGPALAEFADRPFAQPEAVRLDELRVVARERRAELVLSLGAPGDAIAALQVIVAEHPERERARGLLIQALYRDGRHTDALAAFGSWRRYLSEELGLDPSPALRRMEQDILRHSLRSAEPRAQPAAQVLPRPVTSFIGRDADCAAVAGRLGQVRLLTLHGPGGVGKTRLGLEVISQIAARYRDGACFCDLAAIQRPAAVTRAISTAAGLSERAFRRLDDQLIEHLASREQWRQAGAWTPQWVTIRTLIDLLTRVGACRDAATLYGAATSATTGAPPYGADADRMHTVAAQLREALTGTEFRACTERGERLDSHQVIDLALEAIARAATTASSA
jgi:hypothetical protein